MATLKDALRTKLTEDELKILPSSFDIVGDIVIFSGFPEELSQKERIIAEEILKLHKNVKVIAKKTRQYSGVYRTPKLEIMAGKHRKETVYRENNVMLKLDVEKVYFSPRLAEERKKIASFVREGEEVLVMFSGCGPYVFVIAKNSKPKIVYGIEKNPIAHKYALENLRLNKMKNIELILGDARKETIKLIEKRITLQLGLKSNISETQLKKILNEKPRFIEFFLRDEDISTNIHVLEKKIQKIKNLKMALMLHQPSCFNGIPVDISTSDKKITESSFECYNRLLKLCRKHKNIIGFIIHPCDCWTPFKSKKETFVRNFRKLSENKDFSRYVYVENVFKKIFKSEDEIIWIIRKAGIKNICLDLPHFFVSKKGCSKKHQKELLDFISKLKQECRLYFHIADCDGKLRLVRNVSHGKKFKEDKFYDESLPVGKGKIDFSKLLSIIDIAILEIFDSDHDRPVNEITSFRKIKQMLEESARFDRIIMPLPKGAEDFLDVAFSAARHNAVIHFYTFLREEDTPKKGVEQITKAASAYKRKIKILGWRKCGHYAPGKFRVCIDFQVQ